jgi:hypothetical protein
MSITRDEAINANEFHHGTCTRTIGPKGGVTEHSEVWRRNGNTQTWKTRPEDYRIPVKHGMRSYDSITPDYAHTVHTAANCPLNDPNYVTTDYRKPPVTA